MENKLLTIRKELKLTQKQLADTLGITQSYYSAMEVGIKNITRKIAEKTFSELGVSPEWFFNSNGNIFNNTNRVNSMGKIDGVNHGKSGGGNEDFSKSNSEYLNELYSKARLMDSVGNYWKNDPIGIKSKKLQDLKISHTKKVKRELSNDFKELYNVLTILEKSDASLEVVSDIFLNVLNSPPDPFDVLRYIDAKNNEEHIPDTIDYKAFRDSYIEFLKKIQPYTEAIEAYHIATEEFLKKIKPIEDNDTI